jgi:hypothetical protein
LVQKNLLKREEVEELEGVRFYTVEPSWMMFVPPLPHHAG